MNRIIVTTPEELKLMLFEILEAHFRPKPLAEKLSETLSLDEAVHLLNENGFTITKGTIYQLTSKNQMPFGKFGNKLVFNRKELLSWAQSQTVRVSDSSNAIAALVGSANKKNRTK